MAVITIGHISYQINRVVIVNNPADKTHGAIRIIATELKHDYSANLAWRADVQFTMHSNPAAKDARFRKGWYFSSWNIGTLLNNDLQIALIDAALADYVAEFAIDARDAEARAAATADAADAASTPAAHMHRATTIDRAIAQRIKISDDMVDRSETLREVAIDYVKTYRGTNSFVQDIAIKLTDYGVLSVAQMRGALNVMIAEAKIERAEAANTSAAIFADNADGAPYIDLRSTSERTVDDAGAPPAAEDAPQDARRLPNGTYTIILNPATDEYRTIRLADAPDHFNAAPGTQIASYLSGADNDGDYTGFAFVLGTSSRIWKKFNDARLGKTTAKIITALNTLLTSADPMSAMREYVLRSARCGVCGRKLSTPDSIRMGIGPVCAGKLADQGYTFEMPKEARAILAAVKTIEATEDAQPKTREEKIAAAQAALANVNELFD